MGMRFIGAGTGWLMSAAFVSLLVGGCSGKNTDYGPQASPQEVVSGAQKSIDQLKANKSLPASIRNAEIKHLESEIAVAQGKASGSTKAGPPSADKR